ncbi:iron chelate uptake ABC transporter family permease subunit [Lysinibacillus sp. NPDC097279]|uniref:iron chelate uptake ABC transporter family permease subunit n=1 Tax=Lysinibacillus sp. NPDC097279 TaxID=3364143 RepID=UPI00381A227B
MHNLLPKHTHRFSIYIVICLLLIFVVAFISVNTGYMNISILSFLQTLLGNGSPDNTLTIFNFRFPRICMAILVGFGCVRCHPTKYFKKLASRSRYTRH